MKNIPQIQTVRAKSEEVNTTVSQSKITVNYCQQEKYHTKYFTFPDDMIRWNTESHS